MVQSRSKFLSAFTLILFTVVAWTPQARSQEGKAEPSVAAKPGEWR